MISSNHSIQLYINGNLADLSDDLGITFERIIRDVTKLTSSDTSYSYTFSLPKTKTNCKIFGFANVPSKLSKFAPIYDAILYNDSLELFNGFLKITEIDSEDFKCNMYENKLNTVETIFGESKMNEINWLVDFDGLSTVNTVNSDQTTKYFFPLVSYGLFQKVPSVSTNNADYYTSKRRVDETNRFYYNSYVPSLNMVEVMKRMCDAKGYNLGGSFMNDELINNIYLSNYIADEQAPLYNYGNPKLGVVSASWDMWTIHRRTQSSYGTILYNGTPTYYLINPPSEYAVGQDMNNFDAVNFINVMNPATKALMDFGGMTSVDNEAKLYHNGWIEIPCDGYFQISLNAEFGLDSGQTALEGITTYDSNGNAMLNQTIPVNINNMPIELHVVRYNAQDGDAENNISHDIIYKGAYPNEAESVDYQPSESASTNTLTTRASHQRYPDRSQTSANRGDGHRGTGNRNNGASYSYPWHYTSYSSSGQSTNLVCVDPYNNNSFVCGLAASQWLKGAAVLKDGRSWSNDYNDIVYDSLYDCDGYYITSGGTNYTRTEWNKNNLQGAPTNSVSSTGTNKYKGSVNLTVRLNQGDLLGIYIVTRRYEPSSSTLGKLTQYQVWSKGTISVKAIAPTSYPKADIRWNMGSKFDKKLNLGNFCNEEQKMSEFFNDVIKAFKLSYTQNGDSIILNLPTDYTSVSSFIDIDNRVNNNEVTIKNISFPKSLQVKYSIDTEEEGFYQSVPYDKLELNNWTEYGDYGSDKVVLNANSDGNDLTQSLDFSYDWLTSFSIMDFYSAKQNGNINYIDFMIPTIGKNEWYIENYRYDEMASNDGRSMNQRMWFRTKPTSYRLPTDITDYKEATDDDWYYITIPTDKITIGDTEYELSYKDKGNTLLSRYFNINYDGSTNEVEADIYITPNEYKDFSNGANVIFDSDAYSVNRIRYALDKEDTSKLTLMKITR